LEIVCQVSRRGWLDSVRACSLLHSDRMSRSTDIEAKPQFHVNKLCTQIILANRAQFLRTFLACLWAYLCRNVFRM